MGRLETVVSLLLLLAGAYFSVKTRFVQVRRFLPSVRAFFCGGAENGRTVSPFEAAATSLAATIGTGNIAGTAGALLLGGPGAIFWMWVSALLGMALKYAEILYAMRFRRRTAGGGFAGGPMCYIERGLPARWHFLAPAFALCAALAALGMGNMAQVNTVAESVVTAARALAGGLSDRAARRVALLTGVAVALLIGRAVLGGSKRVGRAAALLVPLMSVLYIGGAAVVLLGRAEAVGPALLAIVRGAFSPEAALGGAAGITLDQAFRVGVARGVFTHEAGLGTAAIAHAAADGAAPERQALYGIFEVFLDTVVMCTLTALVVLVSGVPLDFGSDAAAGSIVAAAFATRFGGMGASLLLALLLLLFAFSSMLSFSLYGAQCAAYLFGPRAVRPYLAAYMGLCVLGAVAPLALAWRVSEVLNMCMALPNLLALVLLSRQQTKRPPERSSGGRGAAL